MAGAYRTGRELVIQNRLKRFHWRNPLFQLLYPQLNRLSVPFGRRLHLVLLLFGPLGLGSLILVHGILLEIVRANAQTQLSGAIVNIA
jgi:hypothetical protein